MIYEAVCNKTTFFKFHSNENIVTVDFHSYLYCYSKSEFKIMTIIKNKY